MPSEPILKALGAAWSALTENGFSACVMGGMATIHWGHARFTKDIDLLAVIEPQSFDQLTALMHEKGLTPRHAPPVLRVGTHSFIQLIFSPKGRFDGIPVDLLIADSEFLRSAVQRAIPFQLGEERCRVVSCEDLIVLKLQADRLIDRMDVRYLLQNNRSSLNLAYLTKWINELGLVKEWDDWWRDAFPNEPAPVLSQVG